MTKAKDLKLTQEIVKELLDYNEDSGELIWKHRGSHWFSKQKFQNTWNTRYAGKVASNLYRSKQGYQRLQIGILGKGYISHRVVWLWMTGEWPEDHIDHIDRDATNNKWSNLRLVDATGNCLNSSMRSNNKSGVTGVNWREDVGKWRAEVGLRGKNYHLGYFAEEDLDLAAMEVMEFRAENGFHPMHGLSQPHYRQGETK